MKFKLVHLEIGVLAESDKEWVLQDMRNCMIAKKVKPEMLHVVIDNNQTIMKYDQALSVLRHHARYGGYNIGDENNRMIQDLIIRSRELESEIIAYFETMRTGNNNDVVMNIVHERMIRQMIKERKASEDGKE